MNHTVSSLGFQFFKDTFVSDGKRTERTYQINYNMSFYIQVFLLFIQFSTAIQMFWQSTITLLSGCAQFKWRFKQNVNMYCIPNIKEKVCISHNLMSPDSVRFILSISTHFLICLYIICTKKSAVIVIMAGWKSVQIQKYLFCYGFQDVKCLINTVWE